VLAVQGFQVMQAERAVAAAEARLAALRDEAIAARSAAEERSAQSAAQMADAARLMRESRRLTLLADLRQVLGEGDSLTSFALDGSVLRLAGVTQGDVAATVAAIRAVGWVAEVELDGAVAVETGSGNRRFQLQVTLEPEPGE
jgi:Tfp pilus assembly protein PilN